MSNAHQRFVYFMAPIGGGPIKIGSSRNPVERLSAVGKWSPIAIELLAYSPGTHQIEFGLHAHFDAYWKHHEWFDPCIELVALVEFVKTNERLPDWALALKPPKNPTPILRKSLATRSPEWRKQHGEKVRRGWAKRSAA